MPLSKVSYPYQNDTLYIPQLLTNALSFNSTGGAIFSGTIDEFSIVPGIHVGIQNATPRIMFAPPGSTSSANNWQIDVASGTFRWFTPGVTQMSLSDGRLAVGSTILSTATIFGLVRDPARKGLVIRGAVGQVDNLSEWQNSAATLLSYVRNDGYIFSGVGIGASPFVHSGTFVANAQLSSVSSAITNIVLLIRGASGQTADLLQLQNNTPSTLVSINASGNYTATFANPRVTLTNNSGTTTTAQLGADSGNGFVGTTNATTFSIVTNNASRAVFASDGTGVTFNTGSITISRSDNASEGGQINLNRAVDNAVGYYIDVFGSTTTPDLRIFNSAASQIITFSNSGALTIPQTLTTGGALNLNYASPVIASNNASAASIFTSTVTGVTIGSSTIKTTEYPSEPSGTTSGTVTQAAQLNGYKGMPINPRGAAGVALAYTLTASDAGKMIYVSSTPTTPTITIPANTAVAFEIGTTIVVMNDIGAATNVSIAITTDTLQLVSTGATGTRTLARYGMATLVKVTATKWIITGNGVT